MVQPDGSRRLLGDYGEATWSPHGLFVAAASGHSLSAIEPDGTPRWSISAGGRISDPRWSPSGFRIAYRAGRSLRVERADGSESTRVAAASAAVAPAWYPRGRTVAVLLERRSAAGPRSEALLVDPSGGPARRVFAVSGRLTGLAWSPDGSRLLLAWPAADQWLFIPTGRGARPRAIGDVSRVFSPGARIRAGFPRVDGWCCAAGSTDGG